MLRRKVDGLSLVNWMQNAALWITLACAAAAAADICVHLVKARTAGGRRRLKPRLEMIVSQLNSDTADRFIRLDQINRAEVALVVTSIRAPNPASAQLFQPEAGSESGLEIPLQVELPAAVPGVWQGLPRRPLSFWLRDGGSTPRLKISYRWRDRTGRTEGIEVEP